MIKVILFDMDGVLLDNTELIVEAYQKDARQLGLSIPDRKTIISYLGRPWQEMVEMLLGKNEEYKKRHLDNWSENEHKINKITFMDELKEVLRTIKQDKAVVTAGPRDISERSLKKVRHYFKCIVTADDTDKHKPDPEPLLMACQKLNIKPEEAIYVGDHLTDFKAANNAGMGFIGLISGATTKEEFQEAGVEKIISSLRELINLV